METHDTLLTFIFNFESFSQVLFLNKGTSLEKQLSVCDKHWKSGLEHRKSPVFILMPVPTAVPAGPHNTDAACSSRRFSAFVDTKPLWATSMMIKLLSCQCPHGRLFSA